jgi:hypothetical protein
MKKIDENLSTLFDIEPLIPEQKPEVLEGELVTEPQASPEEEAAKHELATIEDDAEFARKNIRELITKGKTAVDNILHVAKESEHPRAYEVAGGLIKNLADLNKDLMDIHKKKKDVAPITAGPRVPGVTVDKAIFVGTTNELIRLIKQQKQDADGNSN